MKTEFADVRAQVAAETRSTTAGPVSATVDGMGKVIALHALPGSDPMVAVVLASALSAIQAAHTDITSYATERLAPYTALAEQI